MKPAHQAHQPPGEPETASGHSLDGATVASGAGVTPPVRFSTFQSVVRLVALGLVWAAMVWVVQRETTAPTWWDDPLILVKDNVYRFLINWSVATAVFAVLSPRVIAGLLLLNLWATTAILSYHQHYQRALSWLTVQNQAGEGGAVAVVALEDAAPYLLLFVPVSIALFLAIRAFRPRTGQQPRLAFAALGIWFVVVVGIHVDHKPLDNLAKFESTDGIAHGYGYAITWLAEAYFVDYGGITKEALQQLEQPAKLLSSQISEPLLGDRIAVVQVESLDDAVMGFKIDGRPVTPQLNEWAKKGNYLRVQAPKRNGSCDSDFSLLFGAHPSQRMAPYRVPGFPFERALTRSLHQRGFKTSFFHGVNGSFFERRGAFEKMGFDDLNFREEIIDQLHLKDPEWTLRDDQLFELAEAKRDHQDRFFEFTVTGTSHSPFRFSLGDHQRQFFANDFDRQLMYFGTVHYVDASLAKYVAGLPDKTVVLIYGDHWSRVEVPELGYASEVIQGFGVVPVVMFRKTADGVEPLAEIPDELAKSANLHLVDVTSWFRSSLDIPSATADPRAGKVAGPF